MVTLCGMVGALVAGFIACKGADVAIGTVDDPSDAAEGDSGGISSVDGQSLLPLDGALTDGGPLDSLVKAQAGLKAASCMGSLSARSAFNDQDRAAVPGGNEKVTCLLSRNDSCSVVKECLGVEVVEAEPIEGGFWSRCEGNVQVVTTATSGSKTFSFKTDCTTFSGVCDPNLSGCALTLDSTCEGGVTSVSTCEGAEAVTCTTENKVSREYCSHYRSMTCSDGQCNASGPACDPYDAGGAFHCEGNAIVGCRVHYGGSFGSPIGEIRRIECADVAPDFTCQNGPKGSFCGLASECDPSDVWANGSCDGTRSVVCRGGKITKIECTELGFTGCDPFTGFCTPNPISNAFPDGGFGFFAQ